MNSFSIEASSFGYEVTDVEDPYIKQFKEYHLIMFGKELAFGIAKHLEAQPTEKDIAEMVKGYSLEIDYGLYTKKTKEIRKKDKKRQREL